MQTTTTSGGPVRSIQQVHYQSSETHRIMYLFPYSVDRQTLEHKQSVPTETTLQHMSLQSYLFDSLQMPPGSTYYYVLSSSPVHESQQTGTSQNVSEQSLAVKEGLTICTMLPVYCSICSKYLMGLLPTPNILCYPHLQFVGCNMFLN